MLKQTYLYLGLETRGLEPQLLLLFLPRCRQSSMSLSIVEHLSVVTVVYIINKC